MDFLLKLIEVDNIFGPVNIEKMRITLYDEYGRQVILNNMDWSCALMFECMYS